MQGVFTSGSTSAKALDCGEKAIKITDAYLSGNMSGSDASKAITNLLNEMDYTNELSTDDEHHNADTMINLYIMGISSSLTMDKFKSDSTSYDELLADIDTLKKGLKDFK